MKYLLLILALTACSTAWDDYNYGPGDWLTDNGLGNWVTMHNYEHFQDPEITINTVGVEALSEACGSRRAKGCAHVTETDCAVYVGERASPATLAHEKRHCHGWCHYRPRYDLHITMSRDDVNRDIDRANHWYECKA